MKASSKERKTVNNNTQRGKARMKLPQSLSVTAGDNNGEIDLIWEPVYEAKTYAVQISKSAEPGCWIQEDIISKSSYTFSNLESGRKYCFRIAAIS